ncbi:MAG TPA: hypothetical protein VE338_15445 [Ktedonobacterales bacterium]|jgi:hypothetical protein|nr:hypothetical protein [Ktedonobacterales bacterium]
MFKNKSRSIIGSASAIAALMLSMAYTSGGAQASAAVTGGDGIGSPHFTTDQSVTNFSANANTIPYFRSQFTDPTNGATYPYTMVGANPANGGTTTIPTEIIPFSFTFTVSADPAVHTLNGADNVAKTIASPVFQTSNVGAAADAAGSASAPPAFAAGRTVNEPSDTTQLGDAIYRAQWGKTGSSYHVLLGQPRVLPTQSFVVPQNLGVIVVGSRSHAHIGLLDYHWFSNRLNQTIRNMHIDPHTLPIILVNNTFLYLNHNLSNCCVLGYHGATSSLNGQGHQQVQTYMFASYSTQGIFAANPGDSVSYIADIHGLSHEVQEWYDDPFVNNAVNPWQTPTAPQYGCTSYLETGDPVVGYGFKITMSNGVTYHPEDEAHFSWFARENPSRAEQGYYTYLNNFPTVAKGC